MQFKNLLTEKRAVSPVIGVILMVAITVILAAVIGTFVLGLGDQVSESAPQAQFTFDFTDPASGGEEVSIAHDGGDSIENSTLSVNVGGTLAWNSDGTQNSYTNPSGAWSGKIGAGDTITLKANADGDISDGDAIRVIWSSQNSDKTATIGQSEFSA